MHPLVWGRMRLYGVQGTQSVRADDEPETRPIIGEEGSTLRLTTTERRLKPRTSPESQPRLGFTGASKNSAHRVFSPACGPLPWARAQFRYLTKLPAILLRSPGRVTMEVSQTCPPEWALEAVPELCTGYRVGTYG